MDRHGRAGGPRAYFPVARGLLEPFHVRRIGASVWVFLAVLRLQSDSTGAVNGAAPVTAGAIADMLGVNDTTVRRHVARLEALGYVHVEVLAGTGLRLWVNNPLPVRGSTTLRSSAQGGRPTLGSSAQAPCAGLHNPTLLEGSKKEVTQPARLALARSLLQTAGARGAYGPFAGHVLHTFELNLMAHYCERDPVAHAEAVDEAARACHARWPRGRWEPGAFARAIRDADKRRNDGEDGDATVQGEGLQGAVPPDAPDAKVS